MKSPHEWAGSAFSAYDVARKYDILRGHCDDVGRDFDSILRTHYTPLLTLAPDEKALEEKRRATRIPDAELRTVPVFATPEQAIEHYQRLVDVGVQYFLILVNGSDKETVNLLATPVMPQIHLASSPVIRTPISLALAGLGLFATGRWPLPLRRQPRRS